MKRKGTRIPETYPSDLNWRPLPIEDGCAQIGERSPIALMTFLSQYLPHPNICPMPTSTPPEQRQPQTLAEDKVESESWRIALLYDSDCPLCMREVTFLQRKDAGRGLVKFVDIAALDYDPAAHGGIEFETAMGRIHAVLPDGSIVKNVEVFRQVYEALGMGWVYAATRWPVIGWLVDRLYDFWADRRLSWTGRPDLATVLREREEKLEGCAAGDRCRMPDSE